MAVFKCKMCGGTLLSIIAMNIDRLAAMLLRLIQFLLNFELSYGLRRCS